MNVNIVCIELQMIDVLIMEIQQRCIKYSFEKLNGVAKLCTQ